jgi:hypothetical protein
MARVLKVIAVLLIAVICLVVGLGLGLGLGLRQSDASEPANKQPDILVMIQQEASNPLPISISLITKSSPNGITIPQAFKQAQEVQAALKAVSGVIS